MKHPSAPPSELYPTLTTDDQNYRLQQISELKFRLEKERDARKALYKKYRRGINIIDGIDAALISACFGMGVSGVGLLSTIVAAPVVLALEIAALSCGVLGVASKVVSRKLNKKANKHDRIRVLADSKLNSIKDLISKSLEDGEISEQEFKFILEEIEKFNCLKNQIRSETGQLSDAEKNKILQQGRNEALASLKKSIVSCT